MDGGNGLEGVGGEPFGLLAPAPGGTEKDCAGLIGADLGQVGRRDDRPARVEAARAHRGAFGLTGLAVSEEECAEAVVR